MEAEPFAFCYDLEEAGVQERFAAAGELHGLDAEVRGRAESGKDRGQGEFSDSLNLPIGGAPATGTVKIAPGGQVHLEHRWAGFDLGAGSGSAETLLRMEGCRGCSMLLVPRRAAQGGVTQGRQTASQHREIGPAARFVAVRMLPEDIVEGLQPSNSVEDL